MCKHNHIIVIPSANCRIPPVVYLPYDLRGEVLIGYNNISCNVIPNELFSQLSEFEGVNYKNLTCSGAMEARNMLLSAVKAEFKYVIFLDDDVIPDEHYFEKLAVYTSSLPDKILFGTLIQIEGQAFWEQVQFKLQMLSRLSFNLTGPVYFIFGNCIWPREQAQRILPLIEGNYEAGGEEIEVMYEIKKHNLPSFYTPELPCGHENKLRRTFLKSFFRYGAGHANALHVVKRKEKTRWAIAIYILSGIYKKEYNPQTVVISQVFDAPSPQTPRIRKFLNLPYRLLLHSIYLAGFGIQICRIAVSWMVGSRKGRI